MAKRNINLGFRVLVVLLSLFSVFVVFSCFVGSQVVLKTSHLVTNEETKGVSESLREKYDMDYNAFCRKYMVENLKLTSRYGGHTIPADFIYVDKYNSDVVVMVHDLGGNRYSNYPMAEFFLENGYSVITYDQRATNENTAETTTLGYCEKYDLIACINYAQQFSKSGTVIVWGTSYGAATAIQAVTHNGLTRDVKCVILESPINDMEYIVEEEIKKMDTKLSSCYMMWCGNVMNNMLLGFSYSDIYSTRLGLNLTVPTFVINSKKDKVTPEFMGEEIYRYLPENVDYETNMNLNQIWTVKDSKHGEIWLDHEEEYREKVISFIRNCN